MTSGTDYASRLQEEIRQTLAGRIGGLEHEMHNLWNHISAAFDRISKELSSVRNLEVPACASMLSEIAAGFNRESGVLRSQELAFLAHFIHGMREKETQEEILNLLLDGAQRFAPRLALFVTRNQQLLGWSSRGMTAEAARRIGACSLACSESPFLSSALEADGLTTTIDISEETALSELMAGEKEGPWHAFPLKAVGRTVAVLLAAACKEHGCDLESLCILMDITGLCVENMALRILQDMKVGRPDAGTPAPPQDKPAVEPEPEAPACAEPLPAPDPARLAALAAELHNAVPAQPVEAFETPTVLEKDSVQAPEIQVGVTEAGTMEEVAPLPADTEIPAPAEAEADFSAVDLALEDAEPAVAEAPPAEVPPQEPDQDTGLWEVPPMGEEEKLHAEAKRFARLLASEIKLYNEKRVLEGRENRDIYVRLKRDIDRSREMYEKRVSPMVSRRVDYFHDEIVRVLGDNDPSTLGSDYPGPRVES